MKTRNINGLREIIDEVDTDFEIQNNLTNSKYMDVQECNLGANKKALIYN